MRRPLPLLVFCSLLLLSSPGSARGAAQDDPLQADTRTVNVELILDASGSMAEVLPDGETRIAAAKRILRGVIEGLPEREGINVGMRVYGHLGDNTQAGKSVSCRSSELLVPVSGLDKAALTAQVEAIQPTGWTPIAYALEQAAADFQPGGESITNAIVLVTDGEETCDPPQQSCDAASALHQSAVTVTTHVVGFALTPQQTELVSCVAEAGGGQLFGAGNAQELSGALEDALGEVGVTLTPAAPLAPVPPAVSLGEIRTLGYHQLTQWPTPLFERGIEVGSETAPIISDDGQRIAFGNHPGEAAADPRNRIFVINADGTGEREVDAYPFLCFCASMIDLSADGSRVVSSDAVQIRVADGNGGGGRELLALDSNEINAVRISGDGSKVFFRVYRDAGIRDTSPAQPIERGIYVINADGSGLRQIVGPSQMAALLGVPIEQAPFFGGIWGLDVSRDGSRVVFASFAEIDPATGSAREGLFAVNGDGSALHRLLGPTFTYVLNGAISGDGSTVAYVIENASDDLQEAGVIGFDGGGQRKLTDNSTGYPGLGTIFSLPAAGSDRIQLSNDGTRLLFGSTGLLYDTTSGDRLTLGASTVSVSGDPTPLVVDGLYRPTMNADATRFAYVFQPFAEPYQLARLDLNPGDLGGAPSVSDASVSPPYVLTEGGSTATVSARVSTPNTFLRVGSRVLFRGLPDPNINTAYYGPMVDDGASLGDAVAGDGVFTYDEIGTDCCAEVGPRIVRIKAETQAGDGLRHATAVDVVPFQVSTQPVEGGPPPTTVPTPVSATATAAPPTATAVPPTATMIPPTATAVPPTATPVPPTAIPPSTATAGQTPTSPGTGDTCNCDELAAAQATIAAQETRIAKLEAGTGLTPTLPPAAVPPTILPPNGTETATETPTIPPPQGTETAPETPMAMDFITPDPTECTITPRTPESLAALAATPDQTAIDALAAAMVDETLTIPDGTPADAATTAAVVETYRLMIACFNAGNDLAAYALWTDAALRQIAAQPPAGEPTPLPEAERSAFRVTEVRMLADGRVAAVMEERNPLVATTLVQILSRQGDRYVVADTVDAAPTSPAPTPAATPLAATPLAATPPAPLTPEPPPSPTAPPPTATATTPATATTGTGTGEGIPPAADFITPDPAECTITPRTAEELAALAATPDPAAVNAMAAAMVDETLTIPEGAPADAATTAAVVETYRLMVACFNAGNDLAAYALWSDAALRQSAVQPPTGEPTPVPVEEREAFWVREVRLLPDGRVVAVLEGRGPQFATTLVQVLERQGDHFVVADTVDAVFA